MCFRLTLLARLNERTQDGRKMHPKAYTKKHKFRYLVGTAHQKKDPEFKKIKLQTQRTATASRINKQALRGALHQIVVENLDVERRPEAPRLKDNIKKDLRVTRCGG